MVRTWGLFTSSGAVVYRSGTSSFSLEPKAAPESRTDRHPVRRYAGDSARYVESQPAKASAVIGEPCEWRELEPTEMFGVSF